MSSDIPEAWKDRLGELPKDDLHAPVVETKQVSRWHTAADVAVVVLGAVVALYAFHGARTMIDYWVTETENTNCSIYKNTFYCEANKQIGWGLITASPYVILCFVVVLIFKVAALVGRFATPKPKAYFKQDSEE